MKKITRATLKSFINKNRDRLLVRQDSTFDGMDDCIRTVKDRAFQPIKPADHQKNTLGIQGVWLVGDSRDYFEAFNADGLEGIRTFNCCGSFVVAVPVNTQAAA
jgi:hypothetical protein